MTTKPKIVSWTTGIAAIGICFWCLYWTIENALFALSPGGIHGMAIDMRITAVLSTLTTMIFTCLFFLRGTSSILRNHKIQTNISPTPLKLVALILLMVLSVFARLDYEATTKVTFVESRGIPFAFLTVTEIRGLCSTGMIFWECRTIASFNFMALIANVLIIYYLICADLKTFFEL
jgi:hypothetical protein